MATVMAGAAHERGASDGSGRIWERAWNARDGSLAGGTRRDDTAPTGRRGGAGVACGADGFYVGEGAAFIVGGGSLDDGASGSATVRNEEATPDN